MCIGSNHLTQYIGILATDMRTKINIQRILDTTSLRPTSRSSVRLIPKTANYLIHDLDNDIIRPKSSRGIILLL